MSEESSGFLGWLLGLALLAAALFFWRISLVLLFGFLLLGLGAWFIYSMVSKSGRAQSAIEQNDFASALRLLQEGGDSDQLISALRFKVPFPNDELRGRMLEAVRQLIALQDAAADPANPHLPSELREDLTRRTGESLASLWPLCQKLSLLARSKLNPETMADRISNVSHQLQDIARNSEATRHQLANITLGASELEINEAAEQVGAMKWQVDEMRKLDELLAG